MNGAVSRKYSSPASATSANPTMSTSAFLPARRRAWRSVQVNVRVFTDCAFTAPLDSKAGVPTAPAVDDSASDGEEIPQLYGCAACRGLDLPVEPDPAGVHPAVIQYANHG